MIRLLIAGRRAPGITRDAAHRHLRDAHGRLVLCQPDDADAPLAYYAQNHVIDGVYFASGGDHAIERDLLTELCFDDPEAMRVGMTSAYHAEVLAPDEKRFVDDTSAAKMMVDTRPVASGPRTDHKLFALISRHRALDEQHRAKAAAELAGRVAGLPGSAALREHRVLARPGTTPFVDTILEAWFATRDTALAATAALGPWIAQSDAIDRERSLLLVAEAFAEDRLRALYEADRAAPGPARSTHHERTSDDGSGTGD